MQQKNFSLILFFSGFGIFIFTRLSKLVPTIPITILLSFILILRFSRTLKTKKAVWITLPGFIISINIGFWGLFDIGDQFSSLLFNLIRSSILAILYFLPFLIDRFVYLKFKNKWFATLIFPVITTGVFYLLTIEGPFEGTIQPAKFAFGGIVFKQFLSLFGSLGFVFLTSWIASAINKIWEHNFTWKKSKNNVFALILVVLCVYIFGAMKIYLNPVKNTVKIASIVIHQSWGNTPLQKIFKNRTVSHFKKSLATIEKKIAKASFEGAKIASFMEFAMIIEENKQRDLIQELKRIAIENDMYITFSYAYYAKKGKGKNKHILIDNKGNVLIDYSKRYLVGFGNMGETALFKKGAEILQYANTPYGKLTVSICRDMEMEKFIIQAAKQRADIMFTSAYDFPKTWLPNNLQMPVVNGFSMIRPVYNGVTHVQDYNGKILNTLSTNTGIMYTEVPTRGVRTLYSYTGKCIGWLSLIGMICIILFSFRQKKSSEL